MRILLIRRDGRANAPLASDVLTRTRAAFDGVVEPDGLKARQFRAGGADVFFLEHDVAGFRAPFVQEDDEGLALSTEYPIQAAPVLRARGIDVAADRALPRLARELLRTPELLGELAPPFTLVYAPQGGAELFVFTDGLGQAQLEEYADGDAWALSSRLKCFEGAGYVMEPEPLDWAARYTLGWFPLDMTGFRKVKHVGAGVRLRIHAGGIERTTTEVVSSWVRPEPMSKTDCIDLARESLLDMTDAAMELWTRPSVGLSGGWDSRMVAACLLHRGSDMELRVRGNPQRLDVLIAQELAAIVDRPIRAKITSGLPPEEVGNCRDAMLKALTWQAGGFPTKKHKTFLVRKPLLDGGVVNVMGQHGGIGKADFAVKIGAHELAPEDYEDALVAQLMKDCPIFLRTRWKDQIEDVIRRAYRAADAYGLEGLARLHFFFLNEYTRRWGAASINSQSGVVFAPILSTGFMRAAYAYPGEELPTKPFHREVTRQLAPFWEGIPYDSTPGARDRYAAAIAAAIAAAEAALPPEEASGKNWKKQRQWSKYDNRRYWKYVGKSLFQEAVRERGFVKDLFERATAKELVFEKGHQTTADTVVLTYLLGEVYSGLVPGPVTGPPSDN